MRIKRETVRFDGGEASFLSLGAGPATPAVLVHGFGGDALSWQLTLVALAADRRVFAFDLPGHGRSTMTEWNPGAMAFATWLNGALDALGPPRRHLVGHSMGGRIALLASRARPEAVASLSLIACAGLSPFDLGFLRRLAAISSIEEAAACAAVLCPARPDAHEMMARGMLVKFRDPALREALADVIERSMAPAAVAPFETIDWAAFGMPLQFIWGTDDQVIPVPPAGFLPADRPTHRLDGVGHLPQLEAPDVVNRLLRSMMTKEC